MPEKSKEGGLPTVVEDVVRGVAKPLYNFLNPTPNLENLPTPRITEEEFTNFASRFTTIDTGRGCVFTCDFCTIINVQGRTMRFREPKQVVDFVRQSYRRCRRETMFLHRRQYRTQSALA